VRLVVEYVIMGQVRPRGPADAGRQSAVARHRDGMCRAMTNQQMCRSDRRHRLAEQLIRAGEFDVVVAGDKSHDQARTADRQSFRLQVWRRHGPGSQAYDAARRASPTKPMGASPRQRNDVRTSSTRSNRTSSRTIHQRSAAWKAGILRRRVRAGQASPAQGRFRCSSPRKRGLRANTTAESLAVSKPRPARRHHNAVRTSQISDGAARWFVRKRTRPELGLTWLVAIGRARSGDGLIRR